MKELAGKILLEFAQVFKERIAAEIQGGIPQGIQGRILGKIPGKIHRKILERIQVRRPINFLNKSQILQSLLASIGLVRIIGTTNGTTRFNWNCYYSTTISSFP